MVPFCHFLVNSFCCYYSASLDLHRKWHWCKQKVCKKYFRQFDAIFQNNTFCEKESFSLFDTQHIIYEIFCKSLRMSTNSASIHRFATLLTLDQSAKSGAMTHICMSNLGCGQKLNSNYIWIKLNTLLPDSYYSFPPK